MGLGRGCGRGGLQQAHLDGRHVAFGGEACLRSSAGLDEAELLQHPARRGVSHKVARRDAGKTLAHISRKRLRLCSFRHDPSPPMVARKPVAQVGPVSVADWSQSDRAYKFIGAPERHGRLSR